MHHHICHGRIVDDHIVYRLLQLPLFHAKAGGGVGLGVKVAQQDFFSRLCQRGSQIHGRGGFTYAAFLIDHCDNLSHCVTLLSVCFT